MAQSTVARSSPRIDLIDVKVVDDPLQLGPFAVARTESIHKQSWRTLGQIVCIGKPLLQDSIWGLSGTDWEYFKHCLCKPLLLTPMWSIGGLPIHWEIGIGSKDINCQGAIHSLLSHLHFPFALGVGRNSRPIKWCLRLWVLLWLWRLWRLLCHISHTPPIGRIRGTGRRIACTTRVT